MVLGAVACNHKSLEPSPVGSVALQVVNGAITRADGANWTADQIGVTAVGPEAMSALYQNVGYATTSTSTTADFTAISEDIYFEVNDDVTFTAYAPYYKTTDVAAFPGNDGVLSGSTLDQSDLTAIDYLFATGTTANSENPKAVFTFKHKMAQLVVKVECTDETEHASAVSAIQKGVYTLSGLVHEGTFDVTTGEAVATGSAVSDWTLTSGTVTDKGIAYSVVLYPQTVTIGLTGVISNGGDISFNTTQEAVLEAGYSYTYHIIITATSIEAFLVVDGSVVTDWEEGDEWTYEYNGDNDGDDDGDDDDGDDGDDNDENPTSVDLSNLSASGDVYTYSDDVLTITANCTITGGTSSEPYTGEIKIDTGVTEVELNGIYIDWNESNDTSAKTAAMTISSDMTLTITGDNTILMNVNESGTQHECIYVDGGTLTIKGEGSLTLNEDQTDSSNHNLHGGLILDGNANLLIESGNINANGYFRQPAIGALGGDNAGTCGDITINGGTIVAVGGGRSCGIGTGHNGKCGKITINGGNITTSVMSGGNGGGIGSGDSGTCGDIIINGGTVNATATSGTYCAAIGSINANSGSGVCGDIYITKNVTSLTATGGNTEGSYVIGLGKSDTTCGTVYLGCSNATDTSVTEWTPTDGQFSVTGGGDDLTLVYGWTEEDGTWTKEN